MRALAWPDIIGPFVEFDPREVRTFKLPNGRTRTGNFLFDPTAFAVLRPTGPEEARPGTLGRNVFTGMGIDNVDLSFLRRFSLSERQHLEFRTDVTNLFNHTQFTSYAYPRALVANDQSFGITTRTHGPRRIQFLIRYNF
jgi:hypothetical protein